MHNESVKGLRGNPTWSWKTNAMLTLVINSQVVLIGSLDLSRRNGDCKEIIFCKIKTKLSKVNCIFLHKIKGLAQNLPCHNQPFYQARKTWTQGIFPLRNLAFNFTLIKYTSTKSSYNYKSVDWWNLSEKVGLRLPVFLLTLPDMPLVWPLTRLALHVWFEVKWNFYCRKCVVIYPTRPWDFLDNRTGDKFQW